MRFYYKIIRRALCPHDYPNQSNFAGIDNTSRSRVDRNSVSERATRRLLHRIGAEVPTVCRIDQK